MKITPKHKETRDSSHSPASESSGDLNSAVRVVRETLRTRGTVVLRVAGGSMGPWVRPGDFVVIHRRRLNELNAGRIIVFTRGGRLVIHRILRKGTRAGEAVLFTKGDAAQRPDEPVCADEVLGEVVSIDRECSSLNLNGRGRIIGSRLISKVSPYSQYWYPGARLASRLLSRFGGQSRNGHA
jgi:signal peptidase I